MISWNTWGKAWGKSWGFSWGRTAKAPRRRRRGGGLRIDPNLEIIQRDDDDIERVFQLLAETGEISWVL